MTSDDELKHPMLLNLRNQPPRIPSAWLNKSQHGFALRCQRSAHALLVLNSHAALTVIKPMALCQRYLA